MTERECNRFQARLRLFARRGLDAVTAFDVAERLWQRDRDYDDRRLCVECAHLMRGWRCKKKEAVLADVLQRCPAFAWEVPR